jgi:hypothetical protein
MKALLLFLSFLSLPIHAQVTYFNDSQGMPLGTANRVGNTTYYSDASGIPLGTAQSVGNTTYYNNANGFPLGTANTPQTAQPYFAPQYRTAPAPTFPTAPLFPTSPRGM